MNEFSNNLDHKSPASFPAIVVPESSFRDLNRVPESSFKDLNRVPLSVPEEKLQELFAKAPADPAGALSAKEIKGRGIPA